MSNHPLARLFEPRSLALVGASERAGSVGKVLLDNLLAGRYGGELHLVNPAHREVAGRPCHRSVRALGRAADLAIIAVPARQVPHVLRECADTGIANALVISAGFAERGSEGAALQAELLEAAGGKVRVLGPNSVGVLHPSARLQAFFGPTLAKPGRLALLSQSGAVCTAIVDWAAARAIGFSTVVSVGAAADIGFGELLDYLAVDKETDAILLYVEGVDRARSFLSGLRAAARMKPVVVLKAGRRAESKRAVSSHTGALVGDDAAFDAALRRAGAVRVTHVDELFAAAELLSGGARCAGDRLAVITNAGGLGVMAADRIADLGLRLAELSPATMAALDSALPPHWSHGNPIDVIGDAPPERYASALAPVLADPEIDGVIVLLSPQSMTRPDEVAAKVIETSARGKKPVLACFMGGAQVQSARESLRRAHIPELPSPETAVEAFGQLASYARNQRSLMQVPGPLSDARTPDVAGARAIVERALAGGETGLALSDALALLNAFFIETVPAVAAESAPAAVAAAVELGFPVALKIDSPDITHKSDVGGVKLGLRDAAAVEQAFGQIMAGARSKRPQARLRGVTVERMHVAPAGRELIAGIARDPIFGPVISVGAGGTMVELIADVSVGLPPLNRELARDMIDRTRARRMLGEFRGMPPADIAALEAVLVRLSELACALPEVLELDVNPLIVSDTGAVAVDARVRLAAAPAHAGRYAHVAIEPYPGERTHTFALASGQQLIVRPIRPEDAHMERAFMRELSPESRYLRFHQGISELTPFMLVRFTQLDYDREMAFVAIASHEGEERIVGVARYVQDVGRSSCEFALVVADALQGQGVGVELMRSLIAYARDRGLQQMYGEVLAVNSRMRELMKFLGFSIRGKPEQRTVVRAELSLAP